MSVIKSVSALEILDSRGNPTLAVTLFTDDGRSATAMVPSGASTGEREAVELRDGDPKRYGEKGVLKAKAHVEGPLQEIVRGKNTADQKGIDQAMIAADGTPNKSRFGANAILGVSLAVAKLATSDVFLNKNKADLTLPIPMMNILNGGVHADNGLDFQEFMIRPKSFPSFAEALRCGAEIFHTLKAILKKKGLSTSVGDEGGFAPKLKSHEEALDLILCAIEKAGYRPEADVSLALDCAASEYYDREKNHYRGKEASTYLDSLLKLIDTYPIDSIEDPLDQNDWPLWKEFTSRVAIQVVGDDLFVTNKQFLERGIKEKSANAILIKLNQIGTVTETLETIALAKSAGFQTIISHRSGETEDSFIADFAVATNAGQIKTGSLCRSERIAKYNRLLAIEKVLLN